MRWSGSVLVVALVSCNGGGSEADSSTTDTSGSADDPSTVGDDGPSTSPTDPTGADPTTAPADSSSSDDGEATSGTDTGEPACDDLPSAITSAGLQAHLDALAQIASENGGTRSVGTPGYDASVDYVRGQLESAGYTVSPQMFEVNVFSITGPSTLDVGPVSFAEYRDFQVATYSAGGSPTATATVVDPDLGLGNNSTSGCEAGDFAGFPAGNIAIIQRGTCFLSDKVTNAQAAGASGVVIFNQGDDAGRLGLWLATLGAQTNVTIPVLLSTYDVGASIAEGVHGVPTVAMDVDVSLELRPTANLVVESPGGDPDDVLMIGAHLDSVPAGPGINDNGSGSAAVLEVALAMQGCETTRKVRFAWWGAEEVGLLGSQTYVNSLDQMQRDQIALYMNFDMIGSPNWVRFRYDGDGSAFGDPGPMGSAELEQVFADWFDGMGLATDESPFDGRSDYGPFVEAGIASGGLATGAEGIKTDEQAEVHGGVAGEPYDACYHAACDGVDNIDFEVLTAMGGAIAHAVSLYALP